MPSAPACAIPRNEGAMITSQRCVLDTPLTPLRFSGGENISSVELEQALLSHPAVAEVAVIGVPDQRWGERPKAYVVLRAEKVATEDELIAHVKVKIAGYKAPKMVAFVDALPRSATGKVLKQQLRDLEWAGRATRIHG
jgi:fatty-acyl-CoA synthase